MSQGIILLDRFTGRSLAQMPKMGFRVKKGSLCNLASDADQYIFMFAIDGGERT